VAEALSFALVILVAVTAQWVAWRLKFPSILLLLPAGFAAGWAGWINPEAMLGDALNPMVSLSVGLLLFEGGRSLKFADLQGEGRVVARLVSIGALVTWIGATLGAHYILLLSWQMSLLLGAILMVTGPTVIAPMLRQIRPKHPVSGILRWEGIVIDPIGVAAAVIVLEVILHGGSTGEVVWIIFSLISIGILIGILAASMLLSLLERYAVPGHLEVPVTLLFVLGAIVSADFVIPEAGLVAATWMGVQMANQKKANINPIHEFKETLGFLLIGILFILLSARIDPKILTELSWKHAAFLAILIGARYIGVAISTFGTNLSKRQRFFLGSIAPRGIVAAAVSALFALKLEEAGMESEILVTTTFVVILGTVFVYGLAGRPIAQRLGEADP
jgi:NhaP-type Na+/H+ or K+/H+ antiporter